MNTNLHKFFPFLKWWPNVTKSTIKDDIQAGITNAVLVLPQGVAFAMIAGLPPIYGLYTAMIVPIVAALFGSSWHLISGPTTAISIVVFSSIRGFAEPGTDEFIELVLVLTFLAGVIQLFMGVVRLGSLVNFVSHSVIVAFTTGAALLIATSQMRHVLGLEIPSGTEFYEKWAFIGSHLSETNLYVFAVAISTLIVAVGIKVFLPKWPNMLIAMVFGSVVSLLLDGNSHGVALIGELPASLPSLHVPGFTLERLQLLSPNAFAIALLGLIEAVAIARSIATKSHQNLDGNQEFIGQGLSNIVGSFFMSYAGSGSFTRSGINYQSGAKTPLAAVFAAISLALILLLVAPLTAYLPIPAMGGIILLVAYNLIDFHHIKQIFTIDKSERYVLLVTFSATLFLHLEFAIYIGVFLSLVFYLQRTSKPRIVEIAPNPSMDGSHFQNVDLYKNSRCPQLIIIRIDGSLFFGAIEHVSLYLDNLLDKGEKHVLIVGNGINFIDLPGIEMLVNLSKKYTSKGSTLYLCGLKKNVRDLFQKGNFEVAFGRENIFIHKESAINKIYSKLDKTICSNCDKRVFVECQEEFSHFDSK
jgi:SulP family sulfate permease